MLRLIFAGYAIVLFVGTHWPNLDVRGPVPRSDLWVHLAAFGLWATLATLAGFFGPALSGRNLSRTWVLGVVYACFDEGTQAIPILGRTSAWDDLASNVLGISLAIGVLALLARMRRTASP